MVSINHDQDQHNNSQRQQYTEYNIPKPEF